MVCGGGADGSGTMAAQKFAPLPCGERREALAEETKTSFGWR